jgi:hypothetical protein
MSSRVVGFDRELKKSWLDLTARLVTAGVTDKELKTELDSSLEGELSDNGCVRGAKGKTITVLMKLWGKVPANVQSLRDEAIKIMALSPADSLLFHWGLAMAVYPYFYDAVENVGRLASLQGSFSVSQLQRRMREKYGERETVSRAVNRLVQSLLEWGVIEELPEKRTFKTAKAITVQDANITVWGLEASLIATGNKSGPVDGLIKSQALFPFKFNMLNTTIFSQHPRLQLFRQGVDEDVVILS